MTQRRRETDTLSRLAEQAHVTAFHMAVFNGVIFLTGILLGYYLGAKEALEGLTP